MKTTLKTDITVKDICEGFVYNELEGKKIITLVEYAKTNKLSHSNLINKVNGQTIEAFLENGVWK